MKTLLSKFRISAPVTAVLVVVAGAWLLGNTETAGLWFAVAIMLGYVAVVTVADSK